MLSFTVFKNDVRLISGMSWSLSQEEKDGQEQLKVSLLVLNDLRHQAACCCITIKPIVLISLTELRKKNLKMEVDQMTIYDFFIKYSLNYPMYPVFSICSYCDVI